MNIDLARAVVTARKQSQDKLCTRAPDLPQHPTFGECLNKAKTVEREPWATRLQRRGADQPTGKTELDQADRDEDRDSAATVSHGAIAIEDMIAALAPAPMMTPPQPSSDEALVAVFGETISGLAESTGSSEAIDQPSRNNGTDGVTAETSRNSPTSIGMEAGDLAVPLPSMGYASTTGATTDQKPTGSSVTVIHGLEAGPATNPGDSLPAPNVHIPRRPSVHLAAVGSSQPDRTDTARVVSLSVNLRSADTVHKAGQQSVNAATDSLQSSDEHSDQRRLPIRLGSVHSQRLGEFQAASADQMEVGSTSLSTSALQPVAQDLMGESTNAMTSLGSERITQDGKASVRLRVPVDDRLVVGDNPQLAPLASHMRPAVGLPTSRTLPEQLETFLLRAKELHLSSGDRTEMQMTLEPRELGKLGMRISMENGLVTASFHAESHTVKQLIEAELPRLKDSLQQQGIHLDQVSVQIGGGQSEGFSERQMRDHQRSSPYRQRRAHSAISPAIATAVPANVVSRIKLGYSVDYTV